MSELRPDFLVVYADRFEGFAAVIAASQMSIPVAHIEGGDYTEGGALDDSVRHAITKLAHLHFTTNAEAAERVLRLGEEPWRVENVGLPSLDLARAGIFASPEELIGEFRIRPRPADRIVLPAFGIDGARAGGGAIPSVRRRRRWKNWRAKATRF